MSIEVNGTSVVCCMCGVQHGRRKGNFPVSYAQQHKGIGYIPVCKPCIDKMYNKYLAQCNNSKDAVRQVCRKLDLYWNEKLFEQVSKKNTTHTMMTSYIAKLSTVSYAGKCYDDTLSDEGVLWNFSDAPANSIVQPRYDNPDAEYEATDEVIARWGTGLSPNSYQELEQRRTYWINNLEKEGVVEEGCIDIATEALVRQVCNLEVAINSDRAAGRQISQNVNALNSVLGSMNLKPTQKKDDVDSNAANTPLGVWLYKFEHKRPLPEIDEDLKDVNGLRRYVSVWVRGHLAKMMGIENSYSKMYEDELAKFRVEKPELADEDEEDLLNSMFNEDVDDE